MNRFYFVVKFLPQGADERLLAGRCIRVLHGFLIGNDISGIGVTFPDWSVKTIGKQMAFVSSDKTALQFLRSQQYFEDMAAQGFFSVSGVEIVPADCKEVRFKRNQRISKHSVNGKRRRLQRAKRRAEERGEEFLPRKIEVVGPSGLLHSVCMSSRSNNQQFILNIEKEDLAGESGSIYNNYGLATDTNHHGTVPDLACVMDSWQDSVSVSSNDLLYR